MLGRLYSTTIENTSFGGSSNKFWWYIKAPADRVVILHAFSITSAYQTDERARLRLAIYTSDATGGSGLTAGKINQGNGNASESTVLQGSTPGSTGDVLKAWRWSQQGELLFLPTPELRPVVSAGSRIGLELMSALGSSRVWDGWVDWEEQ